MLSNTILLFEDIQTNRERFIDALSAEIHKPEATPVSYEWDDSAKGTFEEVLYRALSSEQRPAVVISDHDLSQMSGRLTDDVLEPVCQKLLIPLLRYAQRGPDSARDRFARHIYGDLFLIRLSIEEGYESAAKRVIGIFRGFAKVRSLVAKLGDESVLREGPATVLATMLNRQDLRVDLTLYSNSGPQMITKHAPAKELEDKWIDRNAYNLGHWLLNSILRYPGIVLNEVSSAAYANLGIDAFRCKEVQTLFESAIYKGPFFELGPYWWRSRIDAIIDAAGVSDGPEFLKQQGITDTKPSVDPSTGEPGATYYCIVNETPVSKANSIGRLSWVPQGADLARISRSAYETWAPLFNR